MTASPVGGSRPSADIENPGQPDIDTPYMQADSHPLPSAPEHPALTNGTSSFNPTSSSPSASAPPSKLFLSKTRLFLYVAGDFGLAFMWVCKFATTTAYFQTSLRGGPLISHLVWSLGPLSGLFTAPVVGVLSDRCTHWLGRRRPYILCGLVAGVLGANIFAHAGDFGPGPIPLAVAVFGFAVLDIASNMIMFPARALMGDLVLPEQQHDVQGCAAVLACIAEICAGLYILSFGDATITHLGKIFFFASVILTVTVAISVVMCVETPLDPAAVGRISDGEEAELESIGTGSSEGDSARDDARDDALDVSPNGSPDDGSPDDAPAPDDAVPPAQAEFVLQDVRENEGERDADVEVFSRGPSFATSSSLQPADDAPPGADVDFPADAEEEDRPESTPFVIDDDEKNERMIGADGNSSGREAVQGATDFQTRLPRQTDAEGALPSSSRIKYFVDVWVEVKSAVSVALYNFPKQLIGVGIVYFLAWACWFCTLPTYSVWIGESVLGGSPTAEAGSVEAKLYQHGVALFATANMVKALVALAFSYWYPVLLRFIGEVGERTVFGVPFVAFSLILWKWAYTKNEFAALIVIVAGATPFIATQTIPIAIAVARFPENLASNLGILNLFCVGAQLFDTLYTGLIAKYMGEAAVIRVGAFWGLAAGIAAVFLLQ